MSNQTNKIQRLTVTAVLAAIICVVAFLPLRTLGLEITFSMVPVALGAALYGAGVGASLGGVFGLVSFLQCVTGYSPFGATLLSINPLFALIVCLPTRVLAGYLAALVAKAFGNRKNLSLCLSTLAAPLFNTLFFMSALCLCYYNTDYIQGFVSALGAANPFSFVVLFVGINGLVELLAGFIIAFPAAKAVKRFVK